MKEASDTYLEYSQELRGRKIISLAQLADEMNEWRELRDSVYSCMRREGTTQTHDPSETTILKMTEDIRDSFRRLTGELEPTYSDVLDLMIKSNPFRDDKDLASKADTGKDFFASLDTAKIYPDDQYEILVRYRSFLQSAERMGVTSKSDLEEFLRIEDKIFRTFLTHLYKYNHISVSDVTKKSEQIIRNIISASLEGRIDKEETMLYLSHRTTRRILQNSRTCIDDIKRLRISDDKQGQAYLLMAIQPFYEIKPFGIQTMFDSEKEQIRKIAKDIPSIPNYSNRIKMDKETVINGIPKQLLSIYISMY